MIKRTVLVLFVLAAGMTPAAAWDPYGIDEPGEEPAVLHDPQEDDHVWWWQDSAWEPAPPSPPVPAVPAGIYYVTEVYVADVVTVSGALTTYGTATIADTPGTYARVVDTVGTGDTSSFDGTAFNGRATLPDGRQVAGTYYQNFILSNGAFVPVSFVFFQDDSATAAAPVRTPVSPPSTSPPGAHTPPPAPTASPGGHTPMPTPGSVGSVVPNRDPRPATAPPARVPVLRPGVVPSPLGDIAFTLEVLRGRAALVWFRAAADGVTVPVVGWRIVSGEHTALGATSGGPEDPFRARWDLVTGPTQSWVLRVETTVIVDGIAYAASGDVAVFVRAPALIR